MNLTLILFDIDGTLLLTGGASTRSMRRAGQAVIGPGFVWHQPTSGRLDHQNFLELARRNGVPDRDALLTALKSRYLHELKADLDATGQNLTVLPGVRQLLHSLSGRHDVILGLLTGNYRQAAMMKLAVAHIDPSLFPVGTFDEDGDARAALVDTARDQAQRLRGSRPELGRTILIGDTPRDIACARQAGCRILSVASGHYSLDALRAEHPDAAVADLTDTAPLLSML